MKKMIVVLLSAFALLSGGDACFAQVSAARHGGVHSGRDRRPEGYSKDSWTVYYRGLKVEGASASSFVDQSMRANAGGIGIYDLRMEPTRLSTFNAVAWAFDLTCTHTGVTYPKDYGN